jgi:hypothetical protein
MGSPPPCPFCGRAAVQAVALALGLAHSIAVCADEACVTAAGSVLQQQADPSLRLGGGPHYRLSPPSP